MKLILVLLAIAGMVIAAPHLRKESETPAFKGLLDDLLEFVVLIPLGDIKEINNKYLQDDKEFCDVIRYLQSPEFYETLEEIGSKITWIAFKQYLTDNDVPIDIIIELIHEYLESLEPLAKSGSSTPSLKTFRKWLDEVEAIIPTDELKALLEDKMENSEAIKDLYAKVSSDEFRTLVEEICAMPEIQHLAAKLIESGAHVMEALAKIYKFLGWGQPFKAPGDLLEELLEFVALIPLSDIKEINNKHLQDDKEFCDIIRYLQSPEFHETLNEIGRKPTWIAFKQYLTDNDVPIDIIIELIHEYLESLKPLAKSGSSRPSLKTLGKWLDEVEAIIPTDELKALLEDKMQNSKAIRDLYAKVSSDAFRTLVEEICAIPEIQRLAGWGEPFKAPGDLLEELLEFVVVIPLDDIKEINNKHLQGDKEFCDVIRYLQSPEFHETLNEIGKKPTWIAFKQYLTDNDVPIDIIIELIHEYLESLKPMAKSGSSRPSLKTLRQWLDEVEAIIPIHELKALLEDKMQNSKAIRDLYAKVSSDEFRTLVEEICAMPEIQRFAAKLIELGAHVLEALAKSYEFLHWGEPFKASGDLLEELLEFVVLIPLEYIKEINNRHLQDDKAFCDVIRYLQSPEFHETLVEIGNKPTWIAFKQYLTQNSVPIDIIIELIHEYLESLEPLVKSESSRPSLKTLRKWLDEVEAIIPNDELKALLEDKMQNSNAIKELYGKISSVESRTLIEEIRAIPEIQRLAAKLIELGAHVMEAFAKIYEVLGWGEPSKIM